MSVIVVPYINVATETHSGAQREAMMLAIAISAGETAPVDYTVGWSDTHPSAQMTNHDLAGCGANPVRVRPSDHHRRTDDHLVAAQHRVT
jgi:hypothetical protein